MMLVKEATRGATTDLEKARNIFAYVRDHMTCTGIKGKYLSKSLEKCAERKKWK